MCSTHESVDLKAVVYIGGYLGRRGRGRLLARGSPPRVAKRVHALGAGSARRGARAGPPGRARARTRVARRARARGRRARAQGRRLGSAAAAAGPAAAARAGHAQGAGVAARDAGDYHVFLVNSYLFNRYLFSL